MEKGANNSTCLFSYTDPRRNIPSDHDPIITTDFYLTNVEPREWILPTPLKNNETASSTIAAAASNFAPEIPLD